MLHARKDYDRIQDPEGIIPEDEPVFLLRAQDCFAPELLLRWAAKLRLNRGDPLVAQGVEKHAQKMIEWHRSVKYKLPDAPDSSMR